MKRYYTTATDGNVFEHPDGPFVLFAEHEARVRELEDAARSRYDEVGTDALRFKAERDALAAELAAANAKQDAWYKAEAEWNAKQMAHIRRLEAALTLLTNGYKYSTEVVRIAREALGEKT